MADADSNSILAWYDRLRAGDEAAAVRAWDRWFPRLVALARTRIGGMPRRAADEEDVALSAFDSFCRRARRGEFPDVNDGDDLWRILSTITARKAAALVRDQMRQKRGGGRVSGESALDGPDGSGRGLELLPGPALPPDVEAELSERFLSMFDVLDDRDLRVIALMKLDGHTNDEIARRLQRAPATIERRLALIRKIWRREELAPLHPDT